jgi:Flp pilus assembly pilin Flp
MMWLQNIGLLVKEAIQSARDREEGQGLTEYALMLSLVSTASVAVLTLFGGDVNELLDTVVAAFPGGG